MQHLELYRETNVKHMLVIRIGGSCTSDSVSKAEVVVRVLTGQS
jgi:hypothetical protein